LPAADPPVRAALQPAKPREHSQWKCWDGDLGRSFRPWLPTPKIEWFRAEMSKAFFWQVHSLVAFRSTKTSETHLCVCRFDSINKRLVVGMYLWRDLQIREQRIGSVNWMEN
jgi:hypothetical protein